MVVQPSPTVSQEISIWKKKVAAPYPRQIPPMNIMSYLTRNYGVKRQGDRVRKRIFGIKNFSGWFHVTDGEDTRLLRRIVR